MTEIAAVMTKDNTTYMKYVSKGTDVNQGKWTYTNSIHIGVHHMLGWNVTLNPATTEAHPQSKILWSRL